MLELMFPLHSTHIQWTTTEGCQFVHSSADAEHVSLLVCSDPELASSLLLQAAVTCNTSGARVVYITTEPWQQLPKLVHGMPNPDPVLMQRVQMLYLKEMEQVVSYLADIHQSHHVLPDIIVIHALDTYTNHAAPHGGQQHSMARLCALLCDTASYLAHKRDASSTSTRLIASLSDVNNTYTSVYSRFIKDVWTVNGVSCQDGEDEKYEIVHKDKSTTSSRTIAIQFNITGESVFLVCVVQRDNEKVSTSDGQKENNDAPDQSTGETERHSTVVTAAQ